MCSHSDQDIPGLLYHSSLKNGDIREQLVYGGVCVVSLIDIHDLLYHSPLKNSDIREQLVYGGICVVSLVELFLVYCTIVLSKMVILGSNWYTEVFVSSF